MTGGAQIDLSRLAAAIEDVPAGYVRVVDAEWSPDDDFAVALILLNPDDDPWPRICLFARDPDAGGSWYELFQFDCSDGVYEMGDGWVSFVCGRAAPGATAITAVYRDARRTRTPTDGWYLIAFWLGDGQPRPDLPRVC